MSKTRTNDLDLYIWYSRKLVVCIVTKFLGQQFCVLYIRMIQQKSRTNLQLEAKVYRAQKQNIISGRHNYCDVLPVGSVFAERSNLSRNGYTWINYNSYVTIR
jgi:hypothetical protein